mgnify:FL=1
MNIEFGKNSWEYIYTEQFSGSKVFVRSSPKWLTYQGEFVFYWRLEDYLTPQYQYILKGHHDDYDFHFMSEIGAWKYSFASKSLTCLSQEKFQDSMSQGKSLSYTNEAYILSSFLVIEHVQVIQYLEKRHQTSAQS